jgi:uncharacterized membrane protein YjjP (DUF1212 family)
MRVSLGVGGGLLAAIFAAEAYAHGGFLIAFAAGAFVMIGLTARIFGRVRLWEYCLATLGLTVMLLLVGVP